MQIFVSGCLSRTTVQPLNIAGPPEQVKTNSITEYIHAVYRISHEGAVQDSEAYDRLLKENTAIQELAKHVAQNPNDLRSQLQLALVFADHGLNWRAYELLTKLDAALPADAGVALGLARIWDSWEDHGLAKQYAVRAIQLDAGLAAAYDTLARVYLHANDPAGAISAFLKANELEPGDPIPLADAGYAYMLRGDWQQAKIYLERAVALDSSLPEANNNLAIVLAQLGDYDGALQRFSETSRPAAALNNLGVVYLSQHQPKEAMHAFQEALKAEPDYATAKNNLQTTPPAATKPAKTSTIVQLTPWPAAKSASPAATATTTRATSAANTVTAAPVTPAAVAVKPVAAPVTPAAVTVKPVAAPVTPAAMPVTPAAMPVTPVAKPAASKTPSISTNSGMPAAPAISAKPAAPAVPLAAAVPVIDSTREVVEKTIASPLPKVRAAGEPTPLPVAAEVQPAVDPGSTSLVPAAAAVALEEPKSPEQTASIGEPVAVDSAITPPSDPVAADALNVPPGSKASALASNGDLDKSEQKQTDDVKRGIPEAGFLLISVLGSVMGTALGKSRGMIIGAALGPIIQVAVHLCGLSG